MMKRLMKKLKKIWISKFDILEGFWNRIVIFLYPNSYKKKKIEERRKICLDCQYLDKEGTAENTVIKGQPACGICGCNIDTMTACLSCSCSLTDLGKLPKW